MLYDIEVVWVPRRSDYLPLRGVSMEVRCLRVDRGAAAVRVSMQQVGDASTTNLTFT